MQNTRPDLSSLRSAARAQGFEIDLSSGPLEMFLLADPDQVTFTGSWPAETFRAEQEAWHWLERYCKA